MEPYSFPQLEGFDAAAADDAETRAQAIVAEAIGEAARIRAEAIEEGRAEGVQRGLCEIRDGLEPAKQAVVAAIDALEQYESEHLVRLEGEAVELALALAGKILNVALELDRQAVSRIIEIALRAANARDRVVLEVNPADEAVVEEALKEIGSRSSEWRSLELRRSQAVAPGGCVIKTEDGEIDASPEQQLAVAENVLRGLVEQALRDV